MGPGAASVQPTRATDTDPQQQGREVKGYRCANTRGATMLPGTTLAEGHVHMMLTVRSPFDEIEDYINKTKLSDLQTSALWLIAWSGQERAVQRRVAHEAVASS